MAKKKEKEAEKLKEPSFQEEIAELKESVSETKERVEGHPELEVQKLKDQVEKTELDDQLKLQASSQAQNLKTLDDDKKIKKLLELAKSKGVVYAVQVAKKMDDAYVLDALHDKLVEGGYYSSVNK